MPTKKTKPKPKQSYNERDLHKLLSTYLKSKNIYSKTILHEESKNSRDKNQKWIHPDMVGIEFLKLDSTINEAFMKVLNKADTFKLTLSSIRRLDKARSNKFILPLDYSNGDYDKFKTLIDKPFSFLNYNGAHFSVSLDIDIDTISWEDEFDTDEMPYYKEISDIDSKYKKIEKRLIQKEVNTYERIKSLNKAYNFLN